MLITDDADNNISGNEGWWWWATKIDNDEDDNEIKLTWFKYYLVCMFSNRVLHKEYDYK